MEAPFAKKLLPCDLKMKNESKPKKEKMMALMEYTINSRGRGAKYQQKKEEFETFIPMTKEIISWETY